MKRGILLVANLISQEMCSNLIYSIRSSGCNLPIRLIHFGGDQVNSPYILDEVELLTFEDFPQEAQDLVNNLRGVLTQCPGGFLYRFLGWFMDWDQFLYTDNDVVALSNWAEMFDYLEDKDLVHADEEYTTKGIYNYHKPKEVEKIFGEDVHLKAITAGHILVKKNNKMVADFQKAIEWFKENPSIPKMHDQAFLHLASILGNWSVLNLCKEKGWMSSWAGDYKNSLEIIHGIQSQHKRISHLHYSGGTPQGDKAIQELLFSEMGDDKRINSLFKISFRKISGCQSFLNNYKRLKRKINKKQ